MAGESIFSASVTDFLSDVPREYPAAGNTGGGQVVGTSGTIEIAATTEIEATDMLHLVVLPVNARLLSLKIGNDDLGGTLTADVGTYTTASTPVAVDANAIATAHSFSTAAGLTEVLGGDAAPLALHGGTLWELSGVAANPGGSYIVALTVVTSTTPAIGTISWSILYTID